MTRKNGECYGWAGGTFKSRESAKEQAFGRPVVETKPGHFRISNHDLFWMDGRWVNMSEGA